MTMNFLVKLNFWNILEPQHGRCISKSVLQRDVLYLGTEWYVQLWQHIIGPDKEISLA